MAKGVAAAEAGSDCRVEIALLTADSSDDTIAGTGVSVACVAEVTSETALLTPSVA